MRTRTRITIFVTAAAATLTLTACNPDTAAGGSSSGTSANGAPAATSAAGGTKTTPSPVAIPHLVGKGLQTAQDAAQSAGFYHLTSHDSLGRGRSQILDRDWQVCTQTPAAGKAVPVGTELDFGAVKLTEKCPAGGDEKAPAKTGAKMQNFVGKGLKAARESLPGNASVTTKDATGDRIIILESNWKVCTQDPKPGTAYSGQPVAFTAVKTGETCP